MSRGYATQTQLQECAQLRAQGAQEHLARLLVSKGYLSEPVARQIYDELSQRSGAHQLTRSDSRPAAPTAGFGAPRLSWRPPRSGFRRPASRLRLRPPHGSGFGAPPHGSGFGAPAPSSGYGQPNGSGFGTPQGSGFGTPQGSGFGTPQGSGFGTPQGSGFGTPQGSGFGGFGSGSGSHAKQLPPNVAPDDPIAHAMGTRTNADGSVETVFGPYDILGEIARGGMGIVYRARQRSLKRIVALKVLKEGENASERQVRRFRRETEAAAKLQHPNIVAVHEVGCHEGFHYFTMDLIEGDPLDAIVKRKEKMPVERVLHMIEEVARAIHYAHGKGIIHRDLKPANVLLDTDGHPKVTDFGLAKNLDHKSLLTRTGTVVGTPFYMPPEQARGDVTIDQRADVYALGVILYELLTLKLPFHGETTMEVYHKILEDEPIPPRKHDSRIDRDVNTIVLKAMEKEVATRYPSALELAEDIQRYLNGDPIKARPLGPVGRLVKKAKKNKPLVLVIAGTVLACSAILSVGYYIHRQNTLEEIAKQQATETTDFKDAVRAELEAATSSLDAGINRLGDRDATGALASLGDALVSLDSLQGLVEEYTRFNTEDMNQATLGEFSEEIEEAYRKSYLHQARAFSTQDQFPEALASLARGLERNAEAADLELERGRVFLAQGDLDQAEATFTRQLKADPNYIDARLELGVVQDRRGRTAEALKSFASVVNFLDAPLERRQQVRAHLLRGQTLFGTSRYEEALDDFHRVIELQEDSFEGYVWRGRAQHMLGNYGEARKDLREAVELDPTRPEGHYFQGLLNLDTRNFEDAAKNFETASKRERDYHLATLGQGRALESELKYELAERHYETVVNTDHPAARAIHAEAWAALGDLLRHRADEVEVRLEEEARFRQDNANPDGELGPPPPLDKLLATTEEVLAERRKDAARAYTKALELDESLIAAWIGRGRLRLAEGDLKAAQNDLRQADTLCEAEALADVDKPQQSDTGDDWDKDEWDQEPQWEDDDAVEISSTSQATEARALLGLLALREDQLDAAKRWFERAEDSDPNSAFATFGLARVALARGKREEAQELFEDARSMVAEGTDLASYYYKQGLDQQDHAQRAKKPEFYKTARRAFARAAALNPLDGLSQLQRARLCADWGSLDVALALCREAATRDPLLSAAYETEGFLLARDLPETADPETGRPQALRDPVAARAAFDRAIESAGADALPRHALYGRALARLALAAKQGDDPELLAAARQDLEAAVSKIPDDFDEVDPEEVNRLQLYLRRLVEVCRELGQEDAALEREQSQEQIRKSALAAAARELKEGEDKRNQLNYNDAIEHFDRAIALDPDNGDAHFNRGTCYLKIGNFVPGILDLSRALELNPRIADEVYNKVYQITYVVDLHRVITELNKIVSDHPNEAHVIFLRGFFYVAKAEFKEYTEDDLLKGIDDFNHCLELNTTHVTAMLYRGFLQFKRANPDYGKTPEQIEAFYQEALKDYHAALELDPISGISHYLQAQLWAHRMCAEGLPPERVEEYKTKSLEELKLALDNGFRGYDRLKNEPAFQKLRDDPAFNKLIRKK
ncbi:MAG: tetratricopeptide repeat protein [Planctomycetota bacterium]